MTKFYPVKVADVRRETRDAIVLTLDVPKEYKEAFRFVPGQYLTLRATIDGEEVRRSYSICAAANDTHLRVGIKKVAGGLFSNWASEHLAPGQTIEAMPPMGNFHVPLGAQQKRHFVGFAAGSGITPLLSIVKSTLTAEPQSSFTLFYGNRASSTIMFREELEDLKNEHLDRFSLIHVLSREQQDIDLFNGRIDKEKCDQLLEHWIDVSSIDTAFICGPQDMMVGVAQSLEEHGLDKRRIKFELFATSTPGRRQRRPEEAKAEKRQNLCEATIVIDGRARTISFEKGTSSVLDAATAEGLELPYACKGGVCSTCRAMLVEGEVDMDANFALEDYEVARGYILTCQSYPVTDKIVVDFDK
ncbi:1,2-phenylacetyl-CoA epoxidase subunit PaaE [Microvirga thermotolerans]|uniref:Phenylacetate-CoA oxygenase/reductase subunit PaaK n=1 Tax=Microvirga thermotolerans TaxID=2651334 RepID=A0A5P9JV12_9HYPH|nr:1,2-phenylacetyl-CoA epoxidase subunit PaaE [Microvirga thermotolerans]QFU15618.1 phenylacetate-CoA oxygenase/reductase subunit PaaK [Microvirga thermotolerans]